MVAPASSTMRPRAMLELGYQFEAYSNWSSVSGHAATAIGQHQRLGVNSQCGRGAMGHAIACCHRIRGHRGRLVHMEKLDSNKQADRIDGDTPGPLGV